MRLLACIALAACASGTTVESTLAQLDAAKQINASVLVARGGKVIVSQGYGFASLDSGARNTPQTKFRIGSNTKQFTAAAIQLLQEHGQLSLADPVCNYVSNCPSAWQPITLKMLLIHSSGIPDYTGFDDFPGVIGTAVSVDNLIDRFKPQPLEFAAGSQWSYSNSGYVLLGSVIEKVSGASYADFLSANLFTPLAMTSSGYDANSPDATHATGYLSATEKPVFLDMSEFYSAGALYSTVEDLYKWDTALLAGQVLSASSLADAFSPQIACPGGGCALGTDIGYGFGWFISERATAKYVYHWGRVDGFVSSNGFYADDGVIAIVLSNMETTGAFGISTQLADLARQ